MEFVEQDRVVFTAGLVPDGFSEVGFSGSGRSNQNNTLAVVNKGSGCQFPDKVSIELR